MNKIYYIGGSPCSGKSTVAEKLSQKYKLYYFKVDDLLEKYSKQGAKLELKICTKQSKMSMEQIFERDPHLQCIEELQYYEEIFEFIMSDVKAICADGQDIITEGAAYIPDLMKRIGVLSNQYCSITPTRDFQISHYAKREWIHYILDECEDSDKVFNNWMDRDCLFAKEINRQCIVNGYSCYVNDGAIDIDALCENVASHFGLEA